MNRDWLHERLVRIFLNSNWFKGMNKGFHPEAKISGGTAAKEMSTIGAGEHILCLVA